MDLQVVLNCLVSVATLLISLRALDISYRTFKRQATFENENHLHKYKIDKYNEVLNFLAEDIIFLKRQIDEYYMTLAEGSYPDDYVANKQQYVDQKIEEAEIRLTVRIAFFSEPIAELIESYIDKVFWSNFINCNNDKNYNQADERTNYLRDMKRADSLDNMLLDLLDAMREDVGIDPLSEKLQNRIKERNQKSKERSRIL